MTAVDCHFSSSARTSFPANNLLAAVRLPCAVGGAARQVSACRAADAGARGLPARTGAQRLGRAATAALHDELALAPKPGLVSFVDSGSHRDMDAGTFMRSLFALRHGFVQAAALGAAQAPFAQLQALGVAAEARMLAATGGVNTHRGAVFMLGLLCAAGGAVLAGGQACSPAVVRRALLLLWGPALQQHALRPVQSHGALAALRLGLQAAAAEAALGFPAVFCHAVPAAQAARALGLDDRHVRLQVLFTAMATLDDTTLAHRGGLAGLRWAQAQARGFLRAGGAGRPDALAHAQAVHAAFVRRRLSPGGAADVLAATCWLERVCGAALEGKGPHLR